MVTTCHQNRGVGCHRGPNSTTPNRVTVDNSQAINSNSSISPLKPAHQVLGVRRVVATFNDRYTTAITNSIAHCQEPRHQPQLPQNQ
jgi:hypothetical protein